MDTTDKLLKELDLLKNEHKELDALITNSSGGNAYDQLSVQRLKKRKLWLKDRIAWIESLVYPNLIA